MNNLKQEGSIIRLVLRNKPWSPVERGERATSGRTILKTMAGIQLKNTHGLN